MPPFSLKYDRKENGRILYTNDNCTGDIIFAFFIDKKLIKYSSDENDIVLDPFMGSGQTGIASKLLKRRFIGFEIVPEYVKFSNERIAKISEKEIVNLVLFPNAADYILDEIHRQHRVDSFNILTTDLMEEAVRFAYKVTPKDQICLLSTAAPSYTMFSGFPERGKVFKQYVKEIAKESF